MEEGKQEGTKEAIVGESSLNDLLDELLSCDGWEYHPNGLTAKPCTSDFVKDLLKKGALTYKTNDGLYLKIWENKNNKFNIECDGFLHVCCWSFYGNDRKDLIGS